MRVKWPKSLVAVSIAGLFWHCGQFTGARKRRPQRGTVRRYRRHPLRDVGAFVRSEAVAVLGAAVLLAVFLGWLLAEMLVAMLQHVFDPPPDHLAVPWGFLGLLLLGAVLGGLLAAGVAARELRRLPLGAALREQ